MYLIKNGRIHIGDGTILDSCDILTKGKKIEKIGREISCPEAQVIDASGLVVSPGFIDVHSHNDLVPFMSYGMENLKLLQGVTTELVGQCGLGVVPYMEDESKVWKKAKRRLGRGDRSV